MIPAIKMNPKIPTKIPIIIRLCWVVERSKKSNVIILRNWFKRAGFPTDLSIMLKGK
jgi:hypothetical protein